MAYEIQKEINQQSEGQPPKQSTLEKRILYYKSVFDREHDLLDEPWTVLSLANPEHNIPPQVLPAVMKAQADATKAGRPISIREALWVSRFYYILKGTEWEFESDSGLVEIFAQKYAEAERLYRLISDRDRNTDIGKFPDRETLSVLKRLDDSQVYYFMTDDAKPIELVGKELSRVLDEHGDVSLFWIFHPGRDTKFEELLEQIKQKKIKREAQNERISQTEE